MDHLIPHPHSLIQTSQHSRFNMITISISGATKSVREEIESAFFFYVNRLMPRLKTLEVDVKFIRNLAGKECLYGDCAWNDKNHQPRDFTIRLDSAIDLDSIHDTFAHEMIHVKQYVRGELVDLIRTPTACKWMGETVDWTKLEDNEPWEVETYERSNTLYEEWKCYK